MTETCPPAHAMLAHICVPREGVQATAVAPTPPPLLPGTDFGVPALFGAIGCLTVVVIGAWIATRGRR